jgi:hypothetical protein
VLVKVRGTSGVPSQLRELSKRVISTLPKPIATQRQLKMSRQSMAPQRNLSLTEELEKLEQSITLTLQGNQSFDFPTNATNKSRNRPEL